MNLELGKFKKVADTDTHAILSHDNGHRIVVSKSQLSDRLKNDLKNLPMHLDEGGMVNASQMAPKMDDLSDLPQMTAGERAVQDKSEYLKSLNPGLYAGNQDLLTKDSMDQALAQKEAEDFAQRAQQESANSSLANSIKESQEYNSKAQKLGMPLRDIPQAPMSSAPTPMTDATSGIATGPSPASMPTMPHIPNYAQTALNQGLLGLKQEQQVASQIAPEQQAAAHAYTQGLEQSQQRVHQAFDSYMKNTQGVVDSIVNGKIDPKHYVDSMSTGSKIATAIGLLAGGIGGALTGQGNPALKFFDDQINRDIEAQKANLGKQSNILSAYQHLYGNSMDAENALRATMAGVYKAKIDEAAAKTTDLASKARLNVASSKLYQDMLKPLEENAMRSFKVDLMKNQMQNSEGEPSKLVQYMVPKEHQAAAFKEIERAQNTRHMGDAILKSFDNAAKDNTILRTGYGFVRTPASVLGLHQAMQPTFQDLEGTVRQAAMDNTFKNVTPLPGDSEATIKEKRQTLVDYLQSKKSAPVAKGFGIDLNQFSSTTTDPMKKLNPQQQKFAEWAKQNPNDPRSSVVLKKLGLQ